MEEQDHEQAPPSVQLRPDQVEDLALLMKPGNERFAILSDPGTGKTPTVCVYIYWLWKDKGEKTAWAMPKSLLRKNRDELLLWTGFRKEEIVIIDGTPEQRAKQIADPHGKVFLMGFRRWSDDWRNILDQQPEINALVVDEIHMAYGRYSTRRTSGFVRSMRHVERFVPMTGSLINGRLDSAYPTIHVIEPRYYFSEGAFFAHHAVSDADGKVIMWKNHDKLGRIFARHGVRRTFESIHGKVDIVTNVVLCDMSPKQLKAYKEVHEQAMLELEDRFLDLEQPGVATLRARQIMQHPEAVRVPTAWDDEGQPCDWKTYKISDELTGKDEQLIIDLQDANNRQEPLIIFAAYVPEQERLVKLCEKHGRKVGLINGNVSGADRSSIDEAFRAGRLDTVVSSWETAAVGYNWGHVDHIIGPSLDYKDVNVMQGLRRAIRGKRSKPLRFSLYKYRSSLDHRVFQIIDMKSHEANKVDESYRTFDLSQTVRDEGRKAMSLENF